MFIFLFRKENFDYYFKTIEYHSKFGRVHFLYIHSAEQNVNNHLERTVLSSHKMNIWTQEISNQPEFIDQSPPPRIPPHLLNVLLNQKLPAHVRISYLCIPVAAVNRISYFLFSVILMIFRNRIVSCFDIYMLYQFK